MGNYKTINRLEFNHYSVSLILVIACVSTVTTSGQSTTQTSTMASNTVAALASSVTAAKQLSNESTTAAKSVATTIGPVTSATSSTSDRTDGATPTNAGLLFNTYVDMPCFSVHHHSFGNYK